MDIKVIYSVNPGKFQEVAKNRTYEQFIAYLQDQPNFTIINLMSEAEKKALYTAAKLRI